MTEPIVRHGGIFCEDLQVKTRHSWIHHLHSTRNIGWLCCCWFRQLATPSASQSVVVTDVFPAVSPPYFPIFRGYLHGLWAEWANVGLAICHRLEPMQWTLSVPRDIVLNWPRPAYICQYHHQWSWVLGPPLIFSPLFSYPRSCHIEAFNKYQEVRLFPENYPSTHWPYQYKIPPLLAKRSVVLAVIQTGASSIFEMSLNEGPTFLPRF